MPLSRLVAILNAMRTAVSALVLVLIGFSSLWLWNESTEPADETMAGVVLTDEPAQGVDAAEPAGAPAPSAKDATPQQLAAQRAAGDVLSSLGGNLARGYAAINEEAATRAKEAAEAEAEREATAQAEAEAEATAQAEAEREATVQAEAERQAARSDSSGSSGSSSGSDGSASPQPVSPPPVQLDDADDGGDDDADDDDDGGDDDADDDDDGDGDGDGDGGDD